MVLRKRKRKVVAEYDAGVYNCKVGRDHGVVHDFVVDLLTHHNLKVLLLQEASNYQKVLGQIKGYTLYQYDTYPDSDDLAILVKDGWVSRFRFLKQMSLRWWGAKNRKWRAPKAILGVRAWKVLWVNWHRAAYQNAKGGYNKKVNAEQDNWVIQQFKATKRRIGISGDFNDGKTSEPMQRVIDEIGLDVIGDGIEFVMYMGNVEMSNFRKLEKDGGSDHHPKVWHVTVYR